MTQEEINTLLARAILDVAKKAAVTWDYDGEENVSQGVNLDYDMEKLLEELAEDKS